MFRQGFDVILNPVFAYIPYLLVHMPQHIRAHHIFIITSSYLHLEQSNVLNDHPRYCQWGYTIEGYTLLTVDPDSTGVERALCGRGQWRCKVLDVAESIALATLDVSSIIGTDKHRSNSSETNRGTRAIMKRSLLPDVGLQVDEKL